MRTTGRILILALGLLLVAGIPFAGPATVHADPGGGHHGAGCGCDCDCMKGQQHGGSTHRHGMQDNTAACDCPMHRHGGPMGGHHGMMGGMPAGMDAHMKETQGRIQKLRALEATMEALKEKDEAGFRAASLEHAKILTDLQESHLKHMEGMRK